MKSLLVCGTFLVSLFLMGCGEKDPSATFVETISKKIIEKNYKNLYQQANGLVDTALSCEIANADYQQVIEKLQLNWVDTMSSWQRIQWVQFGPIKEGGREWALQFWPDKRNLVGKKINALIKDGAPIAQEDLIHSGVIAQGLSAMEYLLFDDSIDTLTDPLLAKQICVSSIAIGKSIQATSKSLHDDWIKYYNKNLKNFKDKSADSEIVDEQQAVSVIINNLVVSIDVMTHRKIGTPFALNNDSIPDDERVKKSNAFFLESWRSQQSDNNVKNNVLALQGILLEGGLKKLLKEKSQAETAKTLETEITTLLTMLESTDDQAPYFKQLSENKPKAIKTVATLYSGLRALKKTITVELTKALQIKSGFNANDGDS